MDKIIVLDFGSQYSHLICRRIREGNVYCELLPYNTTSRIIKEIDPKGIILSGGPASVYLKDSPKPDPDIFKLGYPILGICYGHQLIVDFFGGRIKRATNREYGRADLIIDDKSDLFSRIDNTIKCWMSHGDAAEKIPKGFKILAHTNNSFSAAIGNQERKFYGIQFHPEVIHTDKGIEILKNFSQTISGAKPSWNMESFLEIAIENIRNEVRNDKVLCAVSGGIDSTTVAALLHRAIDNNLQCVFVNHGLLRHDEEKLVTQLLKNRLGIEVVYVDAEKQFFQRLKGVSDPEKKRKVIGEEFANVFVDVAKRNGPFQWLAQGTLYPDVIESGISKGPAAIIKTHHNVGGLPKWLSLKVLEPLSSLYKDEVRKVAKLLHVPDEFLNRHPYPGPGLAVRVIGEVTSIKLRIAKYASKIVEEELHAAGLYDKVWQAYAAVGDDRAVGVLGDERVYGKIVIIRVIDSVDAMTADWTRLPYDVIEKISDRITNEVEGVTWVTYAVSSKPPATIEPQ
ncbi:MAG TPA: glutamine-hydrolyzing GMP synthase [Nitrososphaeraceae archaeon]|nr:glutamine-hydrolyzing GMP synthase [Nitrososphaeraceae archaeon]